MDDRESEARRKTKRMGELGDGQTPKKSKTNLNSSQLMQKRRDWGGRPKNRNRHAPNLGSFYRDRPEKARNLSHSTNAALNAALRQRDGSVKATTRVTKGKR